jgi:hypothetical protein
MALPLLIISCASTAAQERTGPPLAGENALGLYAALVPTATLSQHQPIPRIDPRSEMSSFTGVGTEIGIGLSRYLPDLFVRTSTFLDVRLTWRRLRMTGRADGTVQGASTSDDPSRRSVSQRTNATADMVLAELRFRFDTNPYGQNSAFVSIGASAGHLFSISYRTSYDPSDAGRVNEYGLPDTGPVPNRRYFHSNLYVGGGYRIGTGGSAHSFSIVPAAELAIPTTSLLLDDSWAAFSVRVELGVRLPL